MSKSSIEMQIADRVCEDEKRNAAALGHDRLDVAMLSFGAFCEVWSLSLSGALPPVLTTFRPMRSR